MERSFLIIRWQLSNLVHQVTHHQLLCHRGQAIIAGLLTCIKRSWLLLFNCAPEAFKFFFWQEMLLVLLVAGEGCLRIASIAI